MLSETYLEVFSHTMHKISHKSFFERGQTIAHTWLKRSSPSMFSKSSEQKKSSVTCSHHVMLFYTITWLLWPFSHTHRWRQIHVRWRQQTCFSFFMPPKPSLNYLNFFCIKQIDNIFPCVCTVIDHRRRHRV